METISLVTFIVNSVVGSIGIVINLTRDIGDHLLNAENTIKSEFENSYDEFRENISSSNYRESIRRLKKLHYATHKDIIKLNICEWISKKIPLIIVLLIILTLASVLIGNYAIEAESGKIWKIIFLLVFPAIVFLIEILIIPLILNFENYLKKLKNMYENIEY